MRTLSRARRRAQVARALYARIMRAAAEQRTFRVMVVVPLFPVAGGHADPEQKSMTINLLMHQLYATISRGGRSLLERLRAAGLEPREYVAFFGLRTHGTLSAAGGGAGAGPASPPAGACCASLPSAPRGFVNYNGPPPVVESEQVYVHSKLMITDARCVLIGSANINDRSLLGERDSEVNVLLRDADEGGGGLGAAASAADAADAAAGAAERAGAPPPTPPRVGGGAPSLARTLLAQLLVEHLGLERAPAELRDEILRDPAGERAWASIRAIAASNTRLFDRAFRCVPMDDVTSFAQLDALRRGRLGASARPAGGGAGRGCSGSGTPSLNSRRSFGSSLSQTGRGMLRSLDTAALRLAPALLQQPEPRAAAALGSESSGGAPGPLRPAGSVARCSALTLPSVYSSEAEHSDRSVVPDAAALGAAGALRPRAADADAASAQPPRSLAHGVAEEAVDEPDPLGGLAPALADVGDASLRMDYAATALGQHLNAAAAVDVSMLELVQGHLCELPLDFLRDEQLQPEHPNSLMRELIETVQ